MSPQHLPRRIASVLVPPLVGLGLAAAAVPAQAATVVDNEVCQYNYDSYWRAMPITITGEVTFADDTTLADGRAFDAGDVVPDGTNVPRGTKIQLRNATLKADQLRNGTFALGLPDWIETFGYDSGFLRDGTVVPLSGYAAFEATNTVEGVQAPVRFRTDMTASLDVVNGQVNEASSQLTVRPARLPAIEWTAAGGPISVRQAPGTTMAAVPVGRTGDNVRVNGSVYVEADLGSAADGLRLSFDCTVGDQATTGAGGQGADHTDRLATNLATSRAAQNAGSADPAMATLRSPGFAGVVTGGSTPGALDAEVDASVTTPTVLRARAGNAVALTDARLDVRLTPEQVTSWLGSGGIADLTGSVGLVGGRSTQGTQTTTGSQASVAVPSTGGLHISLPLAATTWTPVDDLGVDVRTTDLITLEATVGGVERTLTLDRRASHRDTAYPFARVLGPDPRMPPAPGSGGGTQTPPPPIDLGGGTIAPPPVVVPPVTRPKPVAKTTSVRIAVSTLKRRKGRLRVTLANLVKGAGTTGRFTLVAKGRYKVGRAKKARRITLLRATRFALAKGKRRTYAVKLTKDGAALLKRRRSVRATLKVTPTRNVTQKSVSRTVTVRR